MVSRNRTSQWAVFTSVDPYSRRNVVVRNRCADVKGTASFFSDGERQIEKSAAWRTGLQEKETIGNAQCDLDMELPQLHRREQQGFRIDSRSGRGVYDIEVANDDNIVHTTTP